MNIAVIIAAAGASTRYAGPRSKLDEDLGGRPVLHRSVELFANREDTGQIIVAGPAAPDAYADFTARHADKLGLLGVRLCKGGAEHRWQTVKNALELLPDSATHVAVHDAARPCTPQELIDRVFDAAAKHGAVIPSIDVPDTLKRVSRETVTDEEEDPVAHILGAAPKKAGPRIVESTVPREHLVLVQTPQVFEVALLRRAYAQKDLTSTDDASLIERLGERVVTVEGDPRNIKITRPADLHLARLILNLKPPAERAVHKRF